MTSTTTTARRGSNPSSTPTSPISPISIRMPRKSSSSISAQDLVKLLGANCKTGFLRQKRTTKFMKSIKWRHQFVVLANSALYIYQNEMSKSPDTSINLLGYVGVQREVTSTCAWVFALVPGAPSLSRKSFACSNETDRREWMQLVKERLYGANNVKDVTLSAALRDKLQLAKDENLSPEELMYTELEFPVASSDDATTTTTTTQDADDEEDDDDDDDDKGLKINNDDNDDDDDEDFEEEDLDVDAFSSSTKSFFGIERRPHGNKQERGEDPTRLSGNSISNEAMDAPDGIMPPRYSAIVGGEEREYQNLGVATAKAKASALEVACTITDEDICRDREACIELLKATKKVASYLIRRSRTGDYKVLSVLVNESTVKEYRIEENYGLYHLLHDKQHEFPTMSSLLAYYSHHKPLPKFDSFLGWGVHECSEVAGQELYEEATACW